MLENIQLVISDIDGTLLHGTQTELSPAVLAQINRLRSAGVHFCPASGRQYQSLRRIFAPIAGDICYICDNGCILYGKGNPGVVLQKHALPKAQSMQLCADILALEGVELVICGANTSYLCPKTEDLTKRLATYLGNNVACLARPADIPEDAIKICAFSRVGITPALQGLQAKWQNVFEVAVSGKQWLDFNLGNKGEGVRAICAHLGVDPANVLAVGDNFNDVSMLELVGHPYLMQNAAPALQSRFPNHCADVAELLSLVKV